MTARTIVGLNRDWRFAYGDRPADRRWTNDQPDWFDVGLPHSFGVPADLDTRFYVGVGSYQRELVIEPQWEGRRIALRFGAVFQHLQAYLDGVLVGRHDGGYSEFELDLTPYAGPGGHLLQLRVDNHWDAVLPPRAGEHVFNGGVYRDVDLVITDRVHVPRYGVGVTTPEITAERAVVEVSVEVANDTDVDETVDVRCVVHHGGASVEAVSPHLAPAHRVTSARFRFEIADPELWSPDSPALHRVETAILRAGETIDDADDEFGLRWFEFTADRGFFLNGHHLWLTGANVHQDQAGWGDGVTRAAIARDIALIREAGMNFIRGSHYPHSEHFARECDRQGLLFWSEAPFWGTGGESVDGFWTASAYPVVEEQNEEFERNVLDAVTTMIRTNRNRPSIIAWSSGNEVYFSTPEVLENARTLTTRIVEHIRALDPTRAAAVGGTQRGRLDVLGDLAGYNGDGATLFPDPGFPNLVSEYGSFIEDRPGDTGARFVDGTEVQHAWRSGVALWCGFHHGSIFAGMGHMGFIDHRRQPLKSWYWYREQLTGIAPPPPPTTGAPAALRLSADTERIGTDGLDDARLTLEVLDASARRTASPLEATLRVVEGDGRFPTGREHLMGPDDHSLVDGVGGVDLRAYFAGPIRVVASAVGVADTELRLEAVGGPAWDGRPVRFSPGPPFRVGVPVPNEATNIAIRRPVFASGTEARRSADCVTDAAIAAAWAAPDQNPGHWLVIDLEGPRRISSIHIDARGEDEVVVSTSSIARDGEYEPVATARVDGSSPLVLRFAERDVRYIRLQFPDRPLEVTSVEAFQDR